MKPISPLRQRMIEDMTIRNLSPATQRSYLHAVSKLSRYFGRAPDRVELDDVRAFQVHLVSSGVSWPALNQTVCALRFFYGVTLGRGEVPERIAYAREPRKLPICRARRATRVFRPGLSNGPRARSIGSGWRSCRRPERASCLRVWKWRISCVAMARSIAVSTPDIWAASSDG